ncbi:MAG: peptide-methionine (S)-S-oxide reductase [Candidatus Yanofskybacteria bacterium CG10_big_fil_rev_8_21_14_0_10_37_15]|uniref:Peptide methionine sulfoxide reductase MsrA n=1 Tax=Candidatus Yanofskybacteria bacterium CG10_big_fil_rev_8_21_14_0_10_37_15 TaxID=1975097 RepID=A0A2H0R5C7_9BACT|nr:MAG: peptide-methionine (S)-S-oxide reductase [Candidatus Yanofskybacteria bacterium CG10_big_fil_rev_8_21_14_0_10_37_15]
MIKKIVLGGGCFWGMQELIRKEKGVTKTRIGYAGGKINNPTYRNHEGHAEVVEIEYDSEKTSYKSLLDFFFRIHNPTTLNRQGNDIGDSYRSVIFYADDEEKKEAIDFIDIVNKSKRWENPVVTKVEPLEKFYLAEDYHQDYLQKNTEGYTCHAIWLDSYL